MSVPVEKVEIAFDGNQSGNFFTLDNATRGVLDNTTYTLNGSTLYDITSYVKDVQLSRGKNRQLDRFNAGHFSATLDNRNRFFDPTFAASPFYGQVVPRRNLQYSVDNVVQFYGVVDDWNLSYSPDGKSVAEVSAYDGFSQLANQTLAGGTATAQLTGDRITAILNDSGVQWPYAARNIDAGKETLQADVIPANQNVISYINLIEQTEPGMFFIDRTGDATWLERSKPIASASVPVLADDGSGIPYTSVKVVYGSELLYNQSVLTRLNGATATGNDYTSQGTYGVRTLSEDGLLMDSDAALANLAAYLVNQYKNPEFRFETMEFLLNDLSTTQKATLLNLDIGSVCKISFTPNNIAPAITKYAMVIGVGHNGDLDHHVMSLNFQTLDSAGFVLNDAVFGLLDLDTLSY